MFCTLIALIGMFLVSGMVENGLPSEKELLGILESTGAAFLYAMVVILNKKVPVENAYHKTVIQLFSASIALLPYLLIRNVFISFTCSFSSVIPVIFVGLVHTGAAYLLYFGAVEHVPAQVTALLSYADPLSALCLSALILGERMSVLSLLGAFLILAAAFFGSKK